MDEAVYFNMIEGADLSEKHGSNYEKISKKIVCLVLALTIAISFYLISVSMLTRSGISSHEAAPIMK